MLILRNRLANCKMKFIRTDIKKVKRKEKEKMKMVKKSMEKKDNMKRRSMSPIKKVNKMARNKVNYRIKRRNKTRNNKTITTLSMRKLQSRS